MPSPDVQDLLNIASGEQHLNMDFQNLSESGNRLCEKAHPERTADHGYMGMPNKHQHLESLSPGYNVAVNDPASDKEPRLTTQRELEWQQKSTTRDRSETPETPSFARTFHLFDTGHFALEEDLEEMASLIRDFLGRTSAAK